ncbi:S1 family peptidase [Aeropyrum pernix]|nr:S1 family peptidase [Aeropyrum pernix]
MWKEIRFWPDEGSGPCTLGFPVVRAVDGAYGVITAGHCND